MGSFWGRARGSQVLCWILSVLLLVGLVPVGYGSGQGTRAATVSSSKLVNGNDTATPVRTRIVTEEKLNKMVQSAKTNLKASSIEQDKLRSNSSLTNDPIVLQNLDAVQPSERIDKTSSTGEKTKNQAEGIPIVPLAAGVYHSLALNSNGTVWAWGDNSYGKLGDGTSDRKATPVQVTGLNNVRAIAAGENHSVALKSDGTVWTWGKNSAGGLGDGTLENRNSPVQVIGLSSIQAVAAGWDYSLALKSDGTVWAWGWNKYGQLGDGTTEDKTAPVQVTGLSGIQAITAYNFHSLALKSDGTVWAWGYNYNGELGDGTTVDKTIPVQVAGLNGIRAIAAGYSHSMALKSDGTVWTWGYNRYGQLGDGTAVDKTTPVQVAGLSGIRAIAAGQYYSVALRSDGTVWSWGDFYYRYLTPVQVTDLSDIQAIAAGYEHRLTLKSDGTVWAWGLNNLGQLGNGRFDDCYAPLQVHGPNDIGYLNIIFSIESSLSMIMAGTVDINTASWLYPAKYHDVVYRRGIDTPNFRLSANTVDPNIDAYAEITNSNDKLVGRVKLARTGTYSGTKTHWAGAWDWTQLNGEKQKIEDIPIGVYQIKSYLVQKNAPAIHLSESTREFYVIFDYQWDFATSLINREYEITHVSTGIVIKPVQIPIFDESVWKTALKEITFYKRSETSRSSRTDVTVNVLSPLARHITRFSANSMDDFHHSLCNEKEAPFYWDHDYTPSNYFGKAYYYEDAKNKTGKTWVNGTGQKVDIWNAATIGWYSNIIDMLRQDFDPCSKYINRHATGICVDHAMLSVTYLRSVGIKAKPAWLSYINKDGNSIGHAVVRWYDGTSWQHVDNSLLNDEDWNLRRTDAKIYARDKEYKIIKVWTRSDSTDLLSEDITSEYQYSANQASQSNATFLQDGQATCTYDILDVPSMKPGQQTAITVKVSATAEAGANIDTAVALVTIPEIVGQEADIVASDVKTLTIAAGTKVDQQYTLDVPSWITPGQYRLVVYELPSEEDKIQASERDVTVDPNYEVSPVVPDTVNENQPFVFSVTVTNTSTTALNNVMVDLGSLKEVDNDGKQKTIAAIAPGTAETLSWNLTPRTSGNVVIPIQVFTDNAGSYTTSSIISIGKAPGLIIDAHKASDISGGCTFEITVSNSGGQTATGAVVNLAPPDNVNLNQTTFNLGDITQESSQTITVNVNHNETQDFGIDITASATGIDEQKSTAIINIPSTDMFIDILNNNETVQDTSHIDTIYCNAGTTTQVKVYIANTGNKDLHNVVIRYSNNIYQVGTILIGESKEQVLDINTDSPGLGSINITVESDELEKTIERAVFVNIPNGTDLRVKLISSPGQYAVRGKVNVAVEVSNTGNGTPNKAVVNFYIGDRKCLTKNVSKLKPGSKPKAMNVKLTVPGDLAKGATTLKVEGITDPDVNGDNNIVEKGITIVLPDLTITSVGPRAPLVAGKSGTFNIGIENQTIATAGKFTVQVYRGNNELLGEKKVSSLKQGSKNLSIRIKVPADYNPAGDILRVVIDPLSQVAEENEDNNEQSYPLKE